MGIFDNASSVVIGNKEVQSIVRVSDGAVLYQKAQTHSYALAFSSASYQTDSSGDVTVYVTLTDNGVPVSGETVNFSDATSVYTGITNNLGVASVSLNYHSNGTVTASYSNASATASIVSNYTPTPSEYHGPLYDGDITSYLINNPNEYDYTVFLLFPSIVGADIVTMDDLNSFIGTVCEYFEMSQSDLLQAIINYEISEFIEIGILEDKQDIADDIGNNPAWLIGTDFTDCFVVTFLATDSNHLIATLTDTTY